MNAFRHAPVCLGAIVVVTVALLSGGTSAIADTVTTETGTYGADQFIRAGLSANQNQGADPQIIAFHPGAFPNSYRKAYMRFDLASVAGTVTDVALSLILAENNLSPVIVNVWGLDDLVAGEAAPGSGGWAETGITWNNAPGNDTSSPNLFNSVTATQIGTVLVPVASRGATVTLTSAIEPNLLTFLQNDTNDLVTFMLSRQVAGAQTWFASKEHATYAPPALTVTTTPVPVPAGIWMGLGLLGSIGVAGAIRRKLNV